MSINRSLAIVIGINQYQHIPQLKNAVADAVGLASVLKEIYGYEVLLLLNQRATKAELDKLVQSLNKKTIPFDKELIKVDKSDRILFYFAGHGFAQQAQDSEDGKPAGYFMPQDAQDTNKNTWLSMHEVYKAFSDLNCHHLLMILDCCFAGRISWIAQGRNAARSRKLYRQSYDRFVKHKIEQIITSAAHDEEAQDVSRFGQRGEKNGNSPFAHLLLKVLKGNCDRPNGDRDKFIEAIVEDGVITTQELFAYLQNKLGAIAKEQTPGLSQPRKYDPETGEYVYLKGEYIFPLPKFEREKLAEIKLDKNTNPYKGLASFDTKDKDLFFGRTALSQQLAEEVNKQSLTIVLGVSGSGKSSLVKAGLIPYLETLSDSQQWIILNPMRPGESPFKALNKTLTQSKSSGYSGSSIISRDPEEQVKIILGKISYLVSRNSESKLLLVIDQAEELLTLCRNEPKRKNFLNLLSGLLIEYPQQLRIVLTLRFDFEPQLRDVIEKTHWQQAWQQGRFSLTPMNREELQLAIEEPAAQRTLFFESPKLVNQLIDETIDRVGILPLLSFTLSELYLKYLQAEENGARDDRTITEADYQELGGVARSLTQTADRTYDELEKEEKIDSFIIRNVMLRMISFNSGELTRRRVRRSELVYPQSINEQVKTIVNRFIAARLFTTGSNLENQEYVEPVHDALITGWTKIKYWLEEKESVKQISWRNPIKKLLNKNAEPTLKVNLPLQLELNSAANRWKNNQSVDFLWNADPRLDLLKQLLSADDNWFNLVETEFIRRSAGRKERKSFNTRLRRFTAISVFVSLSILTIDAINEAIKARREEIYTSREAAEANLRSGNELEAVLDILRARQKQEEHLFFSFNPIPFKLEPGKQALLKGTMHKVLYQIKERNRLQTNRGSTYQMALSHDNKQLAMVGDYTVALWDLDQNKRLDTISLEEGEAFSSVAFSHDGKTIATGGSDGTVKLWDIAKDGNITPSESYQEIDTTDENTEDKTIYSLVFLNKDKSKLATIGEGDKIKVWDISSSKNQPDDELSTGQKNIIDLAFSYENNVLAIAGGDNKVRLCEVEFKDDESQDIVSLCPKGLTEINFQTDENYVQTVETVAFADDNKLAIGTGDGKIILRKVTQDKQDNTFILEEEKEIEQDLDTVYDIALFNNGRLATIGGDDIVRLRKSSGEEIKPIQPLESSFRNNSVALSPDGKWLATGAEDGTVKLWEADSGKQIKRILTKQGSISSLVFSPDSQQLVTAEQESNEVKFWDINRTYHYPGEADYSISTEQLGIVNVTFDSKDPSRSILRTIGNDRTYKQWDVSEEAKKTGNNFIDKANTKLQNVKSAVFTPDGRVLIALSNDGEVQSWSNSQNSENLLENYEITDLALSPDGTKMAIGDVNGTVWEWDGISEEPQFLLETQQGSLDALAYTPDGRLATVGEDNTVRLWKTLGNTPPKFSPGDEVNSMAFNSESKNLMTVGKDGIAKFWNSSGEQVKQIPVQENVEYQIAFSNDNKLALAGSDGTLRLLDASSNEIAKQQTNQKNTTSVKFSPDGKLLATVGENDKKQNTVRLWQVKEDSTLSPLENTNAQELPAGFASIAFSAENDLLAVVSNNKTVKVRNIAKNQENEEDSFAVEQNIISSLALSHDGKLLATGGEDGSLRLGDASGTLFDQTQTLQGEIKRIVISADNKLLATIGEKPGDTKTLKLWQISENDRLREFQEQKGIDRVAFSPDGKLLATYGEDKQVSLLQIGDEKDLSGAICMMIGNYLKNGSNLADSDRSLCEGIQIPEPEPVVAEDFTEELLSAIAGDFYDRGQEEVSENIVKKTPRDLDDYINKGVAYFRLRNKYPEQNYIQFAINHYTQALEMSPTDSQAVQARVNRGIAYSTRSALGDQERAIDDYNEVINNIDSEYVDAYISKGIALSALPEPQHDEAIDNYERALGIIGDISDEEVINYANAQYALGFTFAYQGDRNKAIDAFQKAAGSYQQQGKIEYFQSAQSQIEKLE